ncbi:Heavy-metal-associated domain-containing protein [Rhodoferax sp. OV413]|nr:Heavy-metal-associated domain-containing protein [Rhodoferax sp. OV413]
MIRFATSSIAATAVFISASMPFHAALAGEALKVTVNGMVCAFCAQGIEKGLSAMPATKAVFVDLKHKVVAVEAKDGHALDRKAIAAEIVDAGYDVVRMETVPQSVADIQAATRAQK